jgi:hypothetical protein
MSEATYSYKVESYALLTQVDKSLLLLNPVLDKWGYAFIVVGLEELEKSFFDLVGRKRPYQNVGGKATLENLKISLSTEFFEAVQEHSLFGTNLLQQGYVVLLKRIADYERVIINHGYDIRDSTQVSNQMHAFTGALVQYLRLLKNCQGDYLLQFHVAQTTRTVVMRYGGFSKKIFSIANMDFTAEEVDRFSTQFTGVALGINEISKIAYDSFTLSHDILDPRTEFVTLMTALESIFNAGIDQISHTVSRHLALIVSSNEIEFVMHYQAVKKLYGIRSKIVHGDAIKANLTTAVQHLKTYVRQVLQFSLTYQGSKKDLFNYLNVKGFP